MTNAFIALGSNVGERLDNIAAALRMLDDTDGVAVVRVSHAYESEPWGVTDQPAFANAVALVMTTLSADVLLCVLEEVEDAMGRVRAERYGPRVIDLDLLLFGDEEWESERLTLPHPRLTERDFVVTPLLEVDPHVRLPDGRLVRAEDAREGRVTGVLGIVPGYEDETPVIEADDLAAAALAARLPVGDVDDEWVVVGPSRDERWARGDFDLLFLESLLLEAGIPVQFDPHRPNTGFVYPGLSSVVHLLVPKKRAEEAQAIVDEALRPPAR